MRWTAQFAVATLLLAGLGCSDSSSPSAPITGGEVAWSASLETDDDQALLVTPATALRAERTYAVILTRGIRGTSGGELSPSEDFAALIGESADAGAPIALWSTDPNDPANPYPDQRLVRADGSVRVPERFALRGLPDTPDLARARQRLRESAVRLGTLGGFSTTAPIRIALSSPVDVDTLNADTLLFFEREDDTLDLESLLDEAERRGVPRSEIALAISFPTQRVEVDLVAIQSLLAERAEGRSDLVVLEDPDPDDDLPIGVFSRGDGEFQSFLANTPEVSAVVTGLVRSPDFRDEEGIFVEERIHGSEPAPEANLDFVLTLPSNASPPYPVVLLQHGFGGSNQIVLDLGQLFAREGLAVIGLSAVAHGRRGTPVELLGSTPFQARDIFRQTIADQMALLRAIEVGIDVSGDGEADLDPSRMSYLGISLGAMLGATLVAIEEILPVAVLNVGGGRVAFLGASEGLRDLVGQELARQVGLTVDHPYFEMYRARTLDIGQHAMDSVDGLNYARRWRIEPFPGHPARRVLLQEGIGDTLVPNESTEALAQAGELEANVPMNDPMGVAGLWRFDPPEGHAIFGREDVRAQAFEFLRSDGTVIIDPGS